MRVITGLAKGMKLLSVDGEKTRPTLDKIKEALFSIIQFEVEDSIVLDLFAGSGGIGIEALSRSAKHVYFCDNSYKAIKVIEENLRRTGLEINSTVIKKDYKKCLETLNLKFNIIFLDPPYKTDYAVQAIEKILEFNLLEKNGILIIETDDEQRITKEIKKMNIYDKKDYGRVKLLFLKHNN